ncbi:MAG: T9SS C-terminal target domain-containing protein, partial [Candidatus Zixiibacteriota bacterium]
AQYVLHSENFVPGNFSVIIVPSLADLDADGDLDLFLTDCGLTTDIIYYQNVGSAAWPQFQWVTNAWQGLTLPWASVRYLRFFDLDEDGDLDLFFLNVEGEEGQGYNLRYYRNVGTPQSPQMQLVTPAWLPLEVDFACPEFCDIDSDGHTDLFVGEWNGGLLFFHGTDTASVSPYTKPRPQRVMDLSLSPQPGNPTVAASYELRAASHVLLKVYDTAGREVRTLVEGWKDAGSHRVTFDGSDLAAGVYLVRLEAGDFNQTQKLVLLK